MLACIFNWEKEKNPSRVKTIKTDPTIHSLQNIVSHALMLRVRSTAPTCAPPPRCSQSVFVLWYRTWDSAALNHLTLDTVSLPAKANE